MANDLNNLLDRVERVDRSLASELRAQISTLARRREFGLNFEKHKPETVELYGRTVRAGDKVRLINRRGQSGPREDSRTWRVQTITKAQAGHQAHLLDLDGDGEQTAPLDELVVVADFRDPIYPGLRSTGAIRRGGDKPHHVVINAENFHALEAMLFTHQGTVSAFFLDPPYNSGARDWKYSNDYVDSEDGYRHSKWLAFMERRLRLARKLLDPTDSVLIISIDEREYLRLGLLLEQTFPEARIQMVSVAINPAAIARGSEFRRADEYYFFVMLGESAPLPVPLASDWITTKGRTHRGEIRWDLLRRSAAASARSDRPGMFFPVFLDPTTRRIHSIGDAIDIDVDRTTVTPPNGTVAVWPIRRNGSEGRWRLGPATTRDALAQGFVKVGAVKGETTPIYYLTVGEQKKIRDGLYTITGRDSDGSVITSTLDSDERRVIPSTQWRVASHDSTQYGSRMLTRFIPDRRFPFPKSLYAVEDALRFFLADKPDAVVVDFFAGSGTTAHAVMRLNHQDGGQRQSIMVTNNEVSATEELSLRRRGHRPGDAEWEALGICDYITKPRIEAAITGVTPAGESIRGEYKFTDPFPMADGLEENVEFFTLTYEDPRVVSADLAFEAISPLLWLRAGGQGPRITSRSPSFEVADTYGVLFASDSAGEFARTLANQPVRLAFIVTDDEKQFQRVSALLPAQVETVRLYESYLRTFEINTGKE